MSNAPDLWRTSSERLRFVGMECPHCGETMFPARMVCQHCRKSTYDVKSASVVERQVISPLVEPESANLFFATVARMHESSVGND